MALVIEDGTGLAASDALYSLAGVKARWDAQGRDYSAKDDETDIEPAIRRASTWLSESFAWAGTRVNGRTQALAWPRYGVTDAEGWSVDSDAVPREVEYATAEAAWQELQTPHSLTPVVTPINQKVLIEVKGIKWQPLGKRGVQDAVPVITAVRDLIGGLLAKGAGNRLAGAVVRA